MEDEENQAIINGLSSRLSQSPPIQDKYASLRIPEAVHSEFAPITVPAAPSSIELPQAQQPDVKSTISQYLLDKYSDENRQKILDANAKDASGINWSAGLAALGAGIAGKDAIGAGQSILKRQDDSRKSKLDAFDTGKSQMVKDYQFKNEMTKAERDEALFKRESDVTSEESKLAQSLAKKMMPGGDFSNMSASQINKSIPSIAKIYDIEQRKLDRQEAREERRFQAGIKLDEKTQGLKTPYGLANTEDDAKKLKEAHESKLNFDSKINEMIALREKHGGGALLNREDVGRAKQLSKDALLEYKNMAKLGVLSQADEAIINAIIPADPLAYDFIPGQDPILHKLKEFKKDKDKDFATRVSTRTRQGIATSNSDTPKSEYPKQVRKGNQVATVSNATEEQEARDEGFQ